MTMVDPVHSYALSELQKDVENELQDVPEAERDALRTKFAIFVVHNKLKPKHADLPPDVPWVTLLDPHYNRSHEFCLDIMLVRKWMIYGEAFCQM